MFHIKGMIEDKETIPEPSVLDDIMKQPENTETVAFLVSVPDQKSKRINITIPETDLKQIDHYANKLHLSRSAFLLKVAKKAIQEGGRK